MNRKIEKDSKPEEVKIFFTLKTRFFGGNSGNGDEGSGDSEDFERQFQKLLTKLANMHMDDSSKNGLGLAKRVRV